MSPVFAAVVAATLALSAPVWAQTPAAPKHDKAFWRAIAASKFAVPAGESVPALTAELSGYLGSPDSEWRDDVAYSTLASWIYRQRIIPVELRRTLLAEWTGHLTSGIGERGTDAVFKRSFSALALGILAILYNEAPFLGEVELIASWPRRWRTCATNATPAGTIR